MRQGIPAKGLVRQFRQSGIIGKRHGPPRTDTRLALIGGFQRFLGCSKFLLN